LLFSFQLIRQTLFVIHGGNEMARRKRRTSCGCGNLPTSPYHHKRGGTGRGHHKMSGLGATAGKCKTWITKAGVRMRGCYTRKGFRITGRA
jgi:hypothetical protein